MNPFWRPLPQTCEHYPRKCRNVIYPIRCPSVPLTRISQTRTYRITWFGTPIRRAFINNFLQGVARNTLPRARPPRLNTQSKERETPSFKGVTASTGALTVAYLKEEIPVRRRTQAWETRIREAKGRLLEMHPGGPIARHSFAAERHGPTRVRFRLRRAVRPVRAGF